MISNMMEYSNALSRIILPRYGNHGVSRSQMPQIDSKDLPELVRYLKGLGINVKQQKMQAKDIALYQNEYSKDKVLNILNSIHKGKETPVLVSSDHFVLDGSHRVIAKFNADKMAKMETYFIDMPAKQALEIINKFPKVHHRTVSDRKIAQ